MKRNNLRTRFAPSPTGLLHLGHAFSATVAHDWAASQGGTFLLRIEDLDRTRCKPDFEAAIFRELDWLGLAWPEPVLRQSERYPVYQNALDRLAAQDLLYPCSCTRTEIAEAARAAGIYTYGPDGLVYPGTCRARPMSDAKPEDALRLNMKNALERIDIELSFTDFGEVHGGQHPLDREHLIHSVGDVVLRRRLDQQPAYHLAVVVDDEAQGITDVVRGADLFEATQVHVVLQALLGYRTPSYHHHRLILDDAGKRLAKRDDARAIAKYREDGLSPTDVRTLVGL